MLPSSYEPNIDHIFDNLKQSSTQIALFEKLENAIFMNEEAKIKTIQLINTFIEDYLRNGKHHPINEWLTSHLDLHSKIWKNEQEKLDIINTIINTIETLTQNQTELQAHLNKRKSIENFYQKKINDFAQEYNINPEELFQNIETELLKSNQFRLTLLTGESFEFDHTDEQDNINLTKWTRFNADLNIALLLMKRAAYRITNAFLGKENISYEAELQKILSSALNSSENKGIQIAISAAVIIAAKNGWIKESFDYLERIENKIENTRESINLALYITLQVATSWDTLIILHKIQQGVLATTDLFAEITKFKVTKIITLITKKADFLFRSNGAYIGSLLGSALGGLLLGNIGSALGGFIFSYLVEKYCKEKSDEFIISFSKKIIILSEQAIDSIKETINRTIYEAMGNREYSTNRNYSFQ